MALTITAECSKAAVDAVCALLNGGDFKLMTSGDAELATPTFAGTAFGAGTSANPSVATAAALTADSSPSAGTVAKIAMQTSGHAARISGSVGTSSGDFQVTDNVIPGGAVSVNVTGLTVTLTLS
jgi:hypothetical protein